MHSLQFTADTSLNGLVERDFTVGEVTGVLWSPASGVDRAPLVLMGRTPGAGEAKRPALQRIGSACGRHPWRVLAVWLLVLAGLLVASNRIGAAYRDNVNLSGTQSNTGLNLLTANDKGAGGYSGLVVIKAGSGTLSANSTTRPRPCAKPAWKSSTGAGWTS